MDATHNRFSGSHDCAKVYADAHMDAERALRRMISAGILVGARPLHLSDVGEWRRYWIAHERFNAATRKLRNLGGAL